MKASFGNSDEELTSDDTGARRLSGPRGLLTETLSWTATKDLKDTAEALSGDVSLVLVASADGVVTSVLERPAAGSGPYPEDLAGLSVDDIWPEDISAPLKDNLRRALRSRQVRSTRLRQADPERSYEFIFVVQGRDRVMLIVRDISEAQEQISRLERLAYADDVTGLPNREWLLGELERITGKLRLQGGRAAVICFEIGQLEAAETASSQARRNEMLAEIAARMKKGLRGANEREEQDDERYSAVARIDFKRFAVALPVIETGEDAAAVTARLTKMLEEPVVIDGIERPLSVSAGIALYPQDGSGAVELLDNAITAMQDAKSSASGRQKFHSGTVRMRALERQDLELELRSALDNEEFTLTYLPIVERQSRRIVTAEALLRWPKPMFGAKPIREVVTVAEYTGMILPIGEWVFERACRQLAEWHEAGHRSLKVSVNVSAQEFARANLIERTERILGETDVHPRFVAVEITEHLLFRDAMRDFPVCRALKDLGVGISVDDYGTGICSFEHLSRSPVDTVKIHLKFVAQAANSATSRAACAAVTAMAHELGISVVAEGVETEEQAETLEEIGCDFLQGFLFCEPSSPEELAARLAPEPSR